MLKTLQVRWLFVNLMTWLGVFTLTRFILLFGFHLVSAVGWSSIPLIIVNGLIYDLGFLAIAGIPLAVIFCVVPSVWIKSVIGRTLLSLSLVGGLYLMWFLLVAEWIFWDEFGVRFNFIAVDYLVYSDEVFSNIRESYPLSQLLGILAAVSVLCWLLLIPVTRWIHSSPLLALRDRWKLGLTSFGLALASFLLLNQNWPAGNDGNTYVRELSRNGPYQFFAAFRNNSLDYNDFYSRISKEQVGKILRAEVASEYATFTGSDPVDIRRQIDNPGEFRQYNIVLVTIESLSAKYLGSFGDARGLSPWLDQLRKKSVFFNNFYATGTRTDRGLEAITLSIPPTPGRSIVKRIGKESGYASLGQQLTERGYDSVFVYGGRGYFDNMNAFFSGNGYRIVDQSSVPESEITFKNAWGMADEDIYNQSLRLADKDFAQGKPFFLQLMTTSNHRPYTYPDGRIDIRSGTGRDGAVKYTDYAIGKFLAKARKKPWFGNTIFVFVADHCAGSAGMEDLPVANYHIPFFIYAPDILQPKEINYLSSQIDIAPTLLGLLNMDYESTFFGRDLLKSTQQPGRAVIGNYQNLGLFDGESLAILSPRKSIRVHEHAVSKSQERKAAEDEALVARDIAYYQGASYVFKKKLNAWHAPLSADSVAANVR